MPRAKSIEEELQSIVGNENLRPAVAGDAVCGVTPQSVVEPENEKQLAAVLSFANGTGLSVAPRGGGTKMDWGNAPKQVDLILSTAKLNKIIEHAWADLTVTVEAGCTLQSLQTALARHGQRLAFDGLWPERATVGGALSTNDSGTLRLRFGALRDLIIGVTLALPDGTLASSGGKVVKNVAGYDLPKLATGALGTLGVITRAVFRLHPLPKKTNSLSFQANSAEEMRSFLLAIQDSKLAHTSLQVRCAAGTAPQVDILFEATDAGLSAQESHLRKLLGSSEIQSSPHSVWNARQDLWKLPLTGAVLAKIGLLPSDLAKMIDSLTKVGVAGKIQWQAVIQATGVGILRLQGETPHFPPVIEELRSNLEDHGGSLVLLRRPPELSSLDAWGNPGDALPLMRAVKDRLDPKSTLNPGRFVGRI